MGDWQRAGNMHKATGGICVRELLLDALNPK